MQHDHQRKAAPEERSGVRCGTHHTSTGCSLMTTTGVKWLRAPRKRRCQHQNIELLSRENEAPVPASRMGHTMCHCVMGCDATWWEPNSNLEALGYL